MEEVEMVKALLVLTTLFGMEASALEKWQVLGPVDGGINKACVSEDSRMITGKLPSASPLGPVLPRFDSSTHMVVGRYTSTSHFIQPVTLPGGHVKEIEHHFVECAVVPKKLNGSVSLSLSERSWRAQSFREPENRPRLSNDRICSPLQLALEKAENRYARSKRKVKQPGIGYHRVRTELTKPGAACHESLKAFTRARDEYFVQHEIYWPQPNPDVEREPYERARQKHDQAQENFKTCMSTQMKIQYPQTFAQREQDLKSSDELFDQAWNLEKKFVDCETNPTLYQQLHASTTEFRQLRLEFNRFKMRQRHPSWSARPTSSVEDN